MLQETGQDSVLEQSARGNVRTGFFLLTLGIVGIAASYVASWIAGGGGRGGVYFVGYTLGRQPSCRVHSCSMAILERRLLSLRRPDGTNILDPPQANSIAAEYDGPWGALRVLAGQPEAWFVWVKPPSGDWPAQDQIEKILRTEHHFGWTTFHPDGGKSALAPPADEQTWRWSITCQREEIESARDAKAPQ
jgi:hypothetical protein